MLKFISCVIFGALLLGIVLAYRNAHNQAATAAMKVNEIKQGGIVDIDISVKVPPKVQGWLYVTASPAGNASGQIVSRCTLGKGQTQCQTTGNVPADAAIGNWRITKIAFQSYEDGPTTVISEHGDLTFQIVKHDDSVLPSASSEPGVK